MNTTTRGYVAGIAVLGGLLGPGASRPAVGQTTITAVAPIAGGSITRVYAVNSNGTAACGYSDNAGGQDVAIRWTNTGGTASMGFLPFGSINSYAQGIDNSGTIIAGYGDSGGVTRAFRWTTGGGYQILPYAAGTSGFNRANGISGNGNVVTGVSGLGAAANGFTWDLVNTPSGVFNVCAGLGAGNAGLAVSNDGSTIVGTCGTGAIRRTYFPTSGLGGLTAIPGQQWAMAEAVSANGAIITGRYSPNTGGEFGYRHGLTVPGFTQALPLTPNGCTALRPRAVNGDGTLIIGQVADNVAGLTAFVWTPAKGTRLLSEHLQLRAANLTGWTLTDATGISSDGSAMCGNGIFNGQARGWVVRGLTCPGLNGGPVLTGAGPCIGQNGVMGGFGFSFQIFTNPYFRWFRNGVELIPGVQPSGSTITVTNTPNLTITNQQYGDAGNYQVGISAEGACETISAALYFEGPGTITPSAQPSDTSACLGQNPSLFATATSTWGVVHKWQKLVAPPSTWANINDGPTGNGSTYVNTNTSTFAVFNAQAADSGRYRCEWSFGFCPPSQTVYSSSALLTVIDSLPAIIGPFDTTGCPGDNDAFLSVSVNPCVGCTYQWQRYDPCPFVNCFNPIFDGPTGNGGSYGGTGTPNLTVAGLYPGDFTQYRCRITMPCAGTVFSNEATISPEPTPSVNIPTGGAGCSGGAAALTVTATPPGGTYQWQKYVGPCFLCYQNVFNGPTGNGGTYSGAQSPTLTINGLNFVDTVTTFRCLVTNSCGNATGASTDAYFAVQDPPLIQTQPVGGNICPNGSRTLSVALVPGNYGTLSYQWWRYTVAGPIFAPVGNGTYVTGSIASGATTPALTISNFKPGDTGQYYCKVTGDCGFTFSSVVNLTHCPPDYNCDGLTTVSDIFDFLAGWFAGNPNANFNGIGGIDVQDIFAFLAAWFAGC